MQIYIEYTGKLQLEFMNFTDASLAVSLRDGPSYNEIIMAFSAPALPGSFKTKLDLRSNIYSINVCACVHSCVRVCA